MIHKTTNHRGSQVFRICPEIIIQFNVLTAQDIKNDLIYHGKFHNIILSHQYTFIILYQFKISSCHVIIMVYRSQGTLALALIGNKISQLNNRVRTIKIPVFILNFFKSLDNKFGFVIEVRVAHKNFSNLSIFLS